MKTIDLLACAWLVLINLVTLFLFGWDKWRSGKSQARISEMKLILFGALGGWPGGLLGMKLFRHKTIKWTFQLKYCLALIPFIAGLWAWQHWR